MLYQAAGLQVRYDFEGDGVWDRVEVLLLCFVAYQQLYDIFSPDDVNSTFEAANYNADDTQTISGLFRDLQGGSIEFQVWSGTNLINSHLCKAFGTCCELYMSVDSGNLRSSIFIPFTNITWRLPAGSAPCGTKFTVSYLFVGFPVGITTGNPLCATSGEVTSGDVTTSPVTTSPLTTSSITTSPLTTSPLTTSPSLLTTASLPLTTAESSTETAGSSEEQTTTGEHETTGYK